MTISKGTVIRTVLLILALVNQFLTIFGRAPLPIEDEQMSELISLAFTIGTSLLAWWKNNSFTLNAIKADEYLTSLKDESKH